MSGGVSTDFLDLNAMDRFPHHHRKIHNVARKSSPYHGRRPVTHPSTSYVPNSKAINANTHEFTIHDDHRKSTGSRDYRGPISNDAAQSKIERHFDVDNADLDPDSRDSAFHWDEEATLLSELMETGPEQSGDEYLEAMVETLQAPFTEQGKLLKKGIAQTLVPTHNRVKAVIQVLGKNVDVTYGQGLSLFNAACKDIERSMYAQHTDFKDVYERITGNIEDAYKELEREYLERDELWLSFHEAIESIVNPALHRFKETPARIENTINKIEKSTKAAAK